MKIWSLSDMSEVDYCEIMESINEVYNSIVNNSEDACDQIRYNPDNTNLWLCIGNGEHCIEIILTDNADEAGFAQGNIFWRMELAWDYAEELLNRYYN